jgi:plasmid stabilization system protein ParE
MPLLVEHSKRAQSDLFAIVQFIAKKNNDDFAAERFGQKIVDRCDSIALAPGAGSPLPRFSGVRKVVKGAYKIIYRVEQKKVVILRIWDGRRGTNPRI